MTVRALLAVAMLVGCATSDDDDGPPPLVIVEPTADGKSDAPDDIDICALAAALPAEDLCSLVCDYAAFATRAAEAGGLEPGTCYSFRCRLTEDVAVNVGVCTPR